MDGTALCPDFHYTVPYNLCKQCNTENVLLAYRVHFTYKRAAILAQMADWAKEDAKLLELTQQISEALEVYNS